MKNMRKFLKWVGIALGSLVGLLMIALVVLNLAATAKLNKKYDIPVEAVTVPTDAQAVERGEHLATIFVCIRCHTDNLGGQVYFGIPGMLSIPAPNLTTGTGGVGTANTGVDWVRAIRHGVGQDGRALMIMPSEAYYYIGDEDIAALIAYIQSLPAVDNPLPERRIELTGRLMMGAGMFPPFATDLIDHTSPRPAAPEPGLTIAYGHYLSHTCNVCHGENLNGALFGPPGQEVPTPNLTPGGELIAWSEQDFITTMRTGITPSGHHLNKDMPWVNYGQMTDDELKAVWMYLQSLPALEQGGVD